MARRAAAAKCWFEIETNRERTGIGIGIAITIAIEPIDHQKPIAVRSSEFSCRPGGPLIRMGTVMVNIPKRDLRLAVIRYGSALAAVVVALLVFKTLSWAVGAELPTYITFYPAVMLVAMFAGFWPGIIATGAAVLVTSYWILPPIGFAVSRPVDSLGICLFSCTGLLLTAVAERYRRARQAEAAYELRKAVAESEERLRLAQEIARVGTFDADIRSGAITWTPELEAMHGLPPGGFAGTQQAWLLLVHPEDRSRIARLVEQSVESGKPTEGEWRVIWPDSTLHWLTGRWQVIKDASERPLRAMGVNFDITERKRADETLHKLNRTLRALSRSNQALMRSADQTAYLQEICRIIVEDCGHAMVWVGLAEEDEAKSVRPVAFSGFAEGYLETLRLTWADTERGRGPTGTAIRTGTFCCCRNMLSDPKFLPWREEALRRGYASSIALPLMAQDRTFGALTIYSREMDPFSDDEVGLLTEIASDLSSGITAFRLREERRFAEESLRESQHRLSLILDSIADGFYALDRQWRFSHINDAALRYFAKSRPEMLGSTLFEAFPIVHGSAFEAQFNHAMTTGEAVHFEASSMVRRDGTVEVHAYPSSDVLTVLFRDVTERRRAEEALRESRQQYKNLVDSERAARSEAERANRLKDEFLANLSHELRTPLNAILGWTQILQRTELEARTRQGLDVIERNTRIQTQLISDLLDMSRIVSGKLRLDVTHCNVGTIIEAAIESLAPAAEAKRIRIERLIDPFAATVLGDPNRLQQAFWNLLSNAVKFTPPGGRVQIVARQADSRVEVSIRDTGLGIEPDFLPCVFDRFRQADSSTARKYGGLGLGLAIVKHIVEMHAGTVVAESGGAGQGATFRVSLPIMAVRAQTGEVAGDEAGSVLLSESVSLRGLKVLVVDDEADTRDMLTRLLQERGAEVCTAASGFKALSLVQDCKPDMLIADIGMAEMDGYEMMRRIRALPPAAGGETPAVALTAFSRAEDRTRALLAGFQAHLIKPVESSELIVTLAMLTRRIPRQAGSTVETPRRMQAGETAK